jgi:cytochrome c-type biogenesis protein CcmH/NrfG
VREADRAVRLDPAAIGAYYVKAAALARFGEAAAARQVLLDAADREPDRFLTWVLLGDLAVRAGDEAAARRAYGRALELNPRNTDLKRLTADPRSALG